MNSPHIWSIWELDRSEKRNSHPIPTPICLPIPDQIQPTAQGHDVALAETVPVFHVPSLDKMGLVKVIKSNYMLTFTSSKRTRDEQEESNRFNSKVRMFGVKFGVKQLRYTKIIAQKPAI